jgi:hypothetical protein
VLFRSQTISDEDLLKYLSSTTPIIAVKRLYEQESGQRVASIAV